MTVEVTGLVAAGRRAGVRRSVRRAFRAVEARLTRFSADSELERLLARGGGVASPVLFRALSTAHRAWRRTGGLFDPRVRAALEALGYGPGLRFDGETPHLPGRPSAPTAPPPPEDWLRVRWNAGPAQPGRRGHRLVLQAPGGLDLGGIGKGLALRYAARRVRALLAGGGAAGQLPGPPGAGPRRRRPPLTLGPCGLPARQPPGFLLNAGGDVWAEGPGPDGHGWRVGVRDPRDPARARLVLRVCGRAVATSGRGRRTWRLGRRAVHHLIDPRSGRPAGSGLWSVTVVGRDPAWAEVWSKALFVAGPLRGLRWARRRGLAAVFLAADGSCRWSPEAARYVEGA